MSAMPPSSSVLLFTLLSLILSVGRLLISSPRQGRSPLIFVKVCFQIIVLSSQWCLIVLISEFILLSDTLGVSTLVDSINNAKPPGATECTVLGPFFTEDAHDCRNLILVLNIIDLPRSSGKRRLDRIRREGRLLVCRGTCNRYSRKTYSKCNH